MRAHPTDTIELSSWVYLQSTLISDLGDIRDVCLEPWRSDYLVSAHFNPVLNGVCLFVGTQKCVIFPT